MKTLKKVNPQGISIIICVHNGANRIKPTLKALAVQTIPKDLQCELLIVDNASTDSTAELSTEYWSYLNSPFPISILSEPKAGKANAIIKGYNNAKYELMLLCDDDNWLQPEYLKTVCEIYSLHPEIGLLGGYGKALFEPGEKPGWFDKWENIYVCGKHHERNGFLNKLDFSIWGAGSVLRKTMWEFLKTNGFHFYNSMEGGKAMSEDAELSMAISFTNNRLYFDERLWFKHDLRGGRITWENLIIQQSWNGKTNAILYMYRLAVDHINQNNVWVNWLVYKKILGLLKDVSRSALKPGNKPRWIYFSNIMKELFNNRKRYGVLARESFQWIKKINNANPLSPNDNLNCSHNS